MTQKILIIDDDESLADLLAQYMTRYDMQLIAANRPSLGYELLHNEKPDAVILDVMLPEQDGFEVCRAIRKTNNVPIIMLTARGDVMDRVVGLEIGADDYLAKPFEPRELIARLQTILRRVHKQPASADLLQFKGLLINPQCQQVQLFDQVIELTNMEYRLLLLLAGEPQTIFSRDEILNHLKGNDVELFSRSVDITISRLRNKLKAESAPEFIKTVWNSGYCFIGEAL